MLKKSLLTMSMVAATVTLSPMATTTVFAETPDSTTETQAPATEAPAMEAPAMEAPATEAPATEAPAVEEPAVEVSEPVVPQDPANEEKGEVSTTTSDDAEVALANVQVSDDGTLTSVQTESNEETVTDVQVTPETTKLTEVKQGDNEITDPKAQEEVLDIIDNAIKKVEGVTGDESKPVTDTDGSVVTVKRQTVTEYPKPSATRDQNAGGASSGSNEKADDQTGNTQIGNTQTGSDNATTTSTEANGTTTQEAGKSTSDEAVPSGTTPKSTENTTSGPHTTTEVVTTTSTKVISSEVIPAKTQASKETVDLDNKDEIEHDGHKYQASTQTTVVETTPGSKETKVVTTTTVVTISGLKEEHVEQTTTNVIIGEEFEPNALMEKVDDPKNVTPDKLTPDEAAGILSEIKSKRNKEQNANFNGAKDATKNPKSPAKAMVFAQKRSNNAKDPLYYDFTSGNVPVNERNFDIEDNEVKSRNTSLFTGNLATVYEGNKVAIPQYIYPTDTNSTAYQNLARTTGNNGMALNIDNNNNLFFMYDPDTGIFGDAFNASELVTYISALKGTVGEIIRNNEDTKVTTKEFYIMSKPKTGYLFSAYVLKREGDGLHIDGILLKVNGATDPNNIVQFTTNSKKTILTPFSESYSKTVVHTFEEITAPKVTETVSREYKLLQDDNTTPDGPVGPVDPVTPVDPGTDPTGPAESGDVTPAAPIVTPAAVDPITVIAPAEDDSMVLGTQRLLSTAEDATFTQDADEPMVLGAQRDLATLPEAEVSAGAVLGASRNATTGDDSAMGYYVYAILASGAGLLLYRRKKENL